VTFDDFQRKAIGVPFVPFGRDYDGWDCWGLVIRAWQDVRGVTLPDFTYKSIADYRALAANFASRDGGFWRRIDPPEPPAARRFLSSIRTRGITPQNRQFVHLSVDRTSAREVGQRHGVPVILPITARDMYRDGFTFYQSDAGLWLTKTIPVSYIIFPDDRER